MASMAGRRIVEMVWEDLKPSDIITPASINNAVIADMALSGSTNSLIHLVAMVRRVGRTLDLDAFAAASEGVPRHLQPGTVGQVLDGGLLLCGRLAGAAVPDEMAESLDLTRKRSKGACIGREPCYGSICFDEFFASRTLLEHAGRGAGAVLLVLLAVWLGSVSRVLPVISAVACLIGAALLLPGCPMCWLVGLIETISTSTRKGHQP